MTAAEHRSGRVWSSLAVMVLVSVLWFGGCSGCRRTEETPGQPASAGSDAAPAIQKKAATRSPGGVIRPGSEVTPESRISAPTPVARATFEPREKHAGWPAQNQEPGEQQPEEPADVPEPHDDAGDSEPMEVGDCIVIIDADPDFGEPPLSVNFSVESQCEGTPSYSWDFGDHSSPSSDPSPTHVYEAAGEYTVRLTATSPDGTKATDEIDISVEAVPAE